MSCYLAGELFSTGGFRAATEKAMIEHFSSSEDARRVTRKVRSEICCRCKTESRLPRSSYCRPCTSLRYWESKLKGVR